MTPKYYELTREELLKDSKIPLRIMPDQGAVFQAMAGEILALIEERNSQGRKTVLICPVGPVGHYPYLVGMINSRRISLKTTWFINMDEYLNETLEWIDEDDPLSFRGFMNKHVYAQINEELIMPEEQRVFPDPKHPEALTRLLTELGGADAVFGGIGITGHVAFNEPEETMSCADYLSLKTRILAIAPETRAVNSLDGLNGAVDQMPRYCITVGMHEISCARKIRLYCFRNWHRAVVRRACHGEPTAAFPVTLLQGHPDISLTIPESVAANGF
ncbi:glucosamine-6-phosphate isomerase [Desulfosporosinus sp. PR]|uniref:glucosamine-6-phosphate isomerase n=1 Tax=Candidatus Desulfosporosinus nitrosoreducens TaxID=3401928 RepID=UPI0027F661C8|nr:glucosamine-6-phosphate isomerase [Desulfosporosinus sp. PR]MDQ7092831.1 glucosamine-6-phosphate isomerase [Desulfosporosinus sp. PR]